MAGFLHGQTSEMANANGQNVSLNDELLQNHARLQRAVEATQGQWSGQSQQAFIQAMDNYNQHFQKFHGHRTGNADAQRQAIQHYGDADQQSATPFNGVLS